ncbi:MAG: cytochrome c [Deltaproteobacteria bacterium]|nr:cytochrome c [Deltaproteobacteria bacterium]
MARFVVAAVVAFGIAGAGAACNTTTESVDGATVFQSTCAGCHGTEGKPADAMIARLGVRDFTAPEFRGRVTAELVAKQVRHGSTNQLMPAFAGALTEEQIKAVAQYVTVTFRAPR